MDDTRDLMRRATEESLESLCFAFVDGPPTVPQDEREEGRARVAFSGPVSGTVSVRILGNAMRDMVKNMLGQESEPSELECSDGLGEIANVVCAHILTRWQGTGVEFSLSPPVADLSHDANGDVAAPHQVVRVSLDGGAIEVRLEVNDDA